METHPKAEQLRNQVAIMRGPLLYCLESKGLSAGKELNNVRIPANIDLKAVPASEFSFGIHVLEGQALYLNQTPWDGELYRPLAASTMSMQSIRMIPYFTWNNRGSGAMSAWLPLEVN